MSNRIKHQPTALPGAAKLASEVSQPESTRKVRFDKKAYQRAYMRKKRAKKKELKQ